MREGPARPLARTAHSTGHARFERRLLRRPRPSSLPLWEWCVLNVRWARPCFCSCPHRAHSFRGYRQPSPTCRPYACAREDRRGLLPAPPVSVFVPPPPRDTDPDVSRSAHRICFYHSDVPRGVDSMAPRAGDRLPLNMSLMRLENGAPVVRSKSPCPLPSPRLRSLGLLAGDGCPSRGTMHALRPASMHLSLLFLFLYCSLLTPDLRGGNPLFVLLFFSCVPSFLVISAPSPPAPHLRRCRSPHCLRTRRSSSSPSRALLRASAAPRTSRPLLGPTGRPSGRQVSTPSSALPSTTHL